MDKRPKALVPLDSLVFGGHSPVHRRRLRPNRRQLNNDLSDDSDTEYRDATDALPNRARNEIVLPIPFTSTSCTTFLQLKKWDFILNLNAALQHARSHHCGVGVLYSCTTCGKTYKGKHAAQCHVPKCKGPSMGRAKLQHVEYAIKPLRHRGVSPNMKGLSTHWSAVRYEKGLQQTKQVGDRIKGTAKCGRKKRWTL